MEIRSPLGKVVFICKDFTGELVSRNEESLSNKFFELDHLPEPLFKDHRMIFEDLLSKKEVPIIT